MAVPSDPTRESLILEGMKAGGQYTVTNTDARYTEFLANQWETLKTEIWNACRTDRFLESEALMLTTIGYSPVTLPTDFDNDISAYLYDIDDALAGTAQTGASSSLTLASTFSMTAADMYGRYLFTLSGTGSGQYRQITAYNDTTKEATVGSAWTTTPDSTTTYVISSIFVRLRRDDYVRAREFTARPSMYSRLGVSMSVLPAPDKVYPILLTYRSNLTRLDDTAGTTFIKHLRERRVLWVEGIKTKTMERYDDERFPTQKQIWETLLRQYSAQNVVYTQMSGSR